VGVVGDDVPVPEVGLEPKPELGVDPKKLHIIPEGIDKQVFQPGDQASARAALRQDGLDCAPVVVVDTSQFATPPGEPATVTATVSCTVSLSSLALPGLPGSARLQASFTSPLDIYRSR